MDAHGGYRGVVTAHAVADTLADGGHDQQTIATVVELPTPVIAEDHLDHALDILDDAYGAIPSWTPTRPTSSAGSPINGSSLRYADPARHQRQRTHPRCLRYR